MKKLIFVVSLGTFLAAGITAQENPVVIPEAGFISSEKYVNAFFGFSLPLPQDSTFRGFIVPTKGDNAYHPLFGLQASRRGLTAFTVTAKRRIGATLLDARDTASNPKSRTLKKIEIDGREFWKGESEEKSSAGRMRRIAYVTAINGYILEFRIFSFDTKLADDLQRCIEAVKFFDPAKAQEIAGQNSQAFNPLALQTARTDAIATSNRIGQLDLGAVSGNIYKNDALGFTFQFPAGWVANEKEIQKKVMEAGHQVAWGNNPSAAREHEAFQGCGRVLLMVTKFPDGTRAAELNPMILVLAFDSACSPGVHFPESLDNHEGIKEMAKQLVRAFAGTPFVSKGKNTVTAFEIQGHLILDISLSFQVGPPSHNRPLEVFTSIDVTELNGYWVGWGFVGDSEQGLEEMKKSNIAFASK